MVADWFCSAGASARCRFRQSEPVVGFLDKTTYSRSTRQQVPRPDRALAFSFTAAIWKSVLIETRSIMATSGLSPSTMYKYDISGVTPVLLMQTPVGTVSINGKSILTLRHDGSFICLAVSSGNNNYDIAKFRTSDFAELRSCKCRGPVPSTDGL